MKLGKRPARIDDRTLAMAKYLTPAAFDPPAALQWYENVKAWPMDSNDTLRDCIPAATAHMIQQWSAYAGDPVTPTDAAVLSMYEQVGGYVPGEPETDQGCNMLDALNWWRKTGMAAGAGVHKIDAFMAVNYSKQSLVKAAVQIFGNVYLGIQLPLIAQGATFWHVESTKGDGAAGSWGGHCVPIVGYDANALTVVTWGQILYMTWNFLEAYGDEAYAVLSPDWRNTAGLSPGVLNLAQLQADLALI